MDLGSVSKYDLASSCLRLYHKNLLFHRYGPLSTIVPSLSGVNAYAAGMGPIGVKAHLKPFLPTHPVIPTGGLPEFKGDDQVRYVSLWSRMKVLLTVLGVASKR